MQEYARLDLLQEIPLGKDVKSKAVAVFRPTAADMADMLGAPRSAERIKIFVERNVRAFNGAGPPSEKPVEAKDLKPFKAADLDAADAAEIGAVLGAMSRDADNVEIRDGDGIFEPLVYDLKHPIHLTRDEDGPVIKQIAFKAQKLGDLSEFMDAPTNSREEFTSFMRGFGQLLGSKLPMSDSIIEALDFVDYLVIRRKIMGKLAGSRGRWKKTST